MIIMQFNKVLNKVFISEMNERMLMKIWKVYGVMEEIKRKGLKRCK